jgi:hypothetical protein
METLQLRRQTDCRQRSAFLSDCAPEPVGRRYSIPKVAVVPRCRLTEDPFSDPPPGHSAAFGVWLRPECDCRVNERGAADRANACEGCDSYQQRTHQG